MVVSVTETAGRRLREVMSRETSESEPSMKCRNSADDVETGMAVAAGWLDSQEIQ